MGPGEEKQPADAGRVREAAASDSPADMEVLEEVVLEVVVEDDEAAPAAAGATATAEKVPGPADHAGERARLDAELKELASFIKDSPALGFLKPRLAQLAGEGVDQGQILGLYRIIAGLFKDDLTKKGQALKTLEDDFQKLSLKTENMRKELVAVKASQSVAAAAEKALVAAEPPLRAELEKKDKELHEFSGRLERMQQDFQNFRGRVKMDMDLSVARAREEWLRKILNVADNFERALGSSRDASAFDALVKGLEMIQDQMGDILAAEGVKEIPTTGEPFDPRLHDALMQEETDQFPEDTVLKPLQKGYTINGKVLRPAMVQISKLPPGKTYTPPAGKGPATEKVDVSRTQAETPPPAVKPTTETATLPAPEAVKKPDVEEKPAPEAVKKPDVEERPAVADRQEPDAPVEAKPAGPAVEDKLPEAPVPTVDLPSSLEVELEVELLEVTVEEVAPPSLPAQAEVPGPAEKPSEPEPARPQRVTSVLPPVSHKRPDTAELPPVPAPDSDASRPAGLPAVTSEPSQEELDEWFADRLGKK